ncbi:hypothetical protein [Arenibaculum sp.]|uniref:hypothetical protein n=1 Tax=Arenibaculum sp. TaxID=2865862 RepID=UPI002E13E4CA|nr:hypothetical protein [Arenibaculum sp.]
MRGHRLPILALLILPTLAVTAWAAWLAAERTAQPALRVAITGYDPRDLLRGHYLEFRLDLADADGLACACLHPDPATPRHPAAVPASCGAPPPRDCRHFIAEPRQVYRYYAAEERALALQEELAATPGGIAVTVHFHGDGTVSFSNVSAGGVAGSTSP